ncbi:hypothetical protein BMR04_11470 [Methylococcaceae bacterium HT3]|nr:hypothetical protein BMR04_11470 [Methylococcaceae bacterium HT3]
MDTNQVMAEQMLYPTPEIIVNQANSGVILVSHQENTSMIRNQKGRQIIEILTHVLPPTDRLKIKPLNKKINEMAKI